MKGKRERSLRRSPAQVVRRRTVHGCPNLQQSLSKSGILLSHVSPALSRSFCLRRPSELPCPSTFVRDSSPTC